MTTAPTTLIPVTILTGYLGSGKTTLLNRILHEDHGSRIAVIENEFGEIGIDNELLVQDRDEQIVEMNNGCICCTVRGDLVRILRSLVERRDAGAIRFDRVIIETTGLADPAPVAQTFFVEDDIQSQYVLDAIITVIDAKHAPAQLDAHHEAMEQVGFADRILLSKTDLVEVEETDRLVERLQRINPRARLSLAPFGQARIEDLLDIRSFDLDAILEIEPDFLHDVTHEHDDAIGSFVFRSEKPFDQVRLEDFFHNVLATHGPDLLRYKGILYVQDLPMRLVFQGVHMIFGSTVGRAWTRTETRASTLVFIGRNLPKDIFLGRLEACLAY